MFYHKSITALITLSYFLILNFSAYAHNIDYNTSILGSKDISEQNTSYNIQKAKLLKGYISSLDDEIFTIRNDHYIKNSRLDTISTELKTMSLALNNTLTTYYEKHHAIGVYDSVINKIQLIKTEISSILKQELQLSIEKLSISKQEKSKKALIVSQKFRIFVNVFTPKVKNIQNTEKRNLILSAISVINIEASKLALFSTKEFTSQRQLDEYYSNSLRTIRRELQKIQNIIITS